MRLIVCSFMYQSFPPNKMVNTYRIYHWQCSYALVFEKIVLKKTNICFKS